MTKEETDYQHSSKKVEKIETDNRSYYEKIVNQFLREKVNKKPEGGIILDKNEEKNNDEDRINNLIKNVNNEFLLNVLSPEIKKNEKKKRKHKDWLMIIMGLFLLFQFVLIGVMIGWFGYSIINAHLNQIPFDDETIKIVFTFIGAYITSVIVELIAILKYIVKNVFDTSVAGMVDNFKE